MVFSLTSLVKRLNLLEVCAGYAKRRLAILLAHPHLVRPLSYILFFYAYLFIFQS
jgi:hypothetical protein